MANRLRVPPDILEKLIKEAGGKCANPGCPNTRTHNHHIREWSVWQTHDADHMIAICPSCHDAVHYSKLVITDRTVRKWKSIRRLHANPRHDQIYVEPGMGNVSLGNGGILYCGPLIVHGVDLSVYDLSEENRLSFRIAKHGFFLTSLRMTTASGDHVITIDDNRVLHSTQPPLEYEQSPGHLRITSPYTPSYLPKWLQEDEDQKEILGDLILPDNRLILVDIEVVGLSTVRIKGICSNERSTVVMMQDWMLLRDENNGNVSVARFGGISMSYEGTNALLIGFRSQLDELKKRWPRILGIA